MKHSLFLVVLAVSFGLFSIAGAQTQWTQASPIQGGQVNCFEVIGAATYAGTWGSGVFKSTDSGVHWTNKGLIGEKVRSLAAQGANLFAGTHNGVFWSPDGGDN